MQLIVMLLTIVSVLTMLSGIAVLFGATKGSRARSSWFFIATVFAAIWIVSVLLVLVARPEWGGQTVATITGVAFVSILFADTALLGYITWHRKIGRLATVVFALIDVVFSVTLITNPGSMYANVVLSNSGNSIVYNIGVTFVVYIVLTFMLTSVVSISLLYRVWKSKSARVRGSNLVLLIGFTISGIIALVFNLIRTLWDWSLIWLGPLAISTTLITFYYTILRYRSLRLSSRWLRILSYIVLLATIAILYMLVFYLVFLAMFRGSSPSPEVIALNFIMVFFFLLLMPAINETTSFMRSLISGESGKADAGNNESGERGGATNGRAADGRENQVARKNS